MLSLNLPVQEATSDLEGQELKILHQISRTISCSLDLDQVLNQIIDLVVEVTGGDSCLVYLLDETREFLILRASKNPHPSLIGQIAMRVGEGITGWVAKEAVPVAIPRDANKDDRFKVFRTLPEDRYEAFLSVPMIAPSDRVIGVINVQHRQAHRHSERERTLISIIGHQVGSAIENARLYQEAIGNSRQISRLIARGKRTEEQLLEMEQLLDLASDAIMVVGEDDSIIYWNNGADRLYGWSREEVIGRKSTELLQPVFQYSREEVQKELSLNRVWQGEVHHSRRNGTRIIVDSRLTLHHQTEGQPSVYLSINTDISDRKLLENQLLQSQKMEAVGRLAGGIAHDFNNLLTVIMGRSELLRGHAADEKLQQGLDLILKTASRAAGLTRQLLAFSRKQVLQPRVINLNAVVLDIEKMLARVIGEDVRLTVSQEVQLGTVRADAGQIEQVILNMVLNSRDAMPEGGSITIETANVHLDELYVRQHMGIRPGPYVMLAVSDTGVGMPSEIQAKIFEPFFTTKEQGKGTGLGLATVYGIVEQSGGHIWVYSEVGRGTTFKIYLPRLDQPAEVPAVPEISGACGTETILLVEDEENVRHLIHEILEMKGYTVLPVRGPFEALHVCESYAHPIHLTITDIVMPVMNGWAMSERLRLQRPDMKVLFMSGYTDAGIIDSGMLESADAFLQKPVTVESLTSKVRKVIDNRGGA